MPVQRSLLFAQCGVMRCGISRCGDSPARVHVKVDGVFRDAGEDGGIGTDLSIAEQLGQGASTAQARGIHFDPQSGQRIEIMIGSQNASPRFAGVLQRAGKYLHVA